ncbi:MAG: cell wall-active antibiotics response protein [Treponema sp.]|jgi:predicted membrane protein|nr:cell wall-active antibiotics response protein [Treponema sp.]
MEVINERKNKLVEKLSSEYALNHISMEEYERLIEYSQKVETDKELKILEKLIDENTSVETNTRREINIGNIEKNYFTFLSSRKTTGPIVSANISNVLGDHKIYLNEDDLIEDETTLNISSVLGSVVIYLPDNVEVVCRVIPILGDVTIKDQFRNKGSRKKLILNGSVILGDLKVKPK